MDSRQRASSEQFLVLIDFMESHGDLSRPQSGPQGRIKQDQLWQELTGLLNSTGGGVVKPVDKWKKVWTDWKAKTKKKALVASREIAATGGGESSRQPLSGVEQRVLGVMSLRAVYGLPGIEERGFDDPPNQSSNTADQHIISPVVMEMLSRHATQLLEDSQSIIQPPPGVTPIATTSLPPPLTPVLEPLVPAPSLTASIEHGGTPRRQRMHTTSPVQRRGRAASRVITPSRAGSTPRRLAFVSRRRRTQTPFERSTSEFVNVENRRLALEENRERNFHQRETRLLEIEDERNKILADIARALIRNHLPTSLPSTDILSSTSTNHNID